MIKKLLNNLLLLIFLHTITNTYFVECNNWPIMNYFQESKENIENTSWFNINNMILPFNLSPSRKRLFKIKPGLGIFGFLITKKQVNNTNLKIKRDHKSEGIVYIRHAKDVRAKETTTGLDMNLSFSSGILDRLNFKNKVNAVFPGTVWCGNGDVSKANSDIGIFFLTDFCCRSHDKCPLSIESNKQLNELKNNGLFARSHCDCDHSFYNCLKKANTFISNKIGETYFNLLEPQCFREEYPIIGCVRWKVNKCITYAVDENKNKTWQWFDNKIY